MKVCVCVWWNILKQQHPGDSCINIHLSFMDNYEVVLQNGKCSVTVTCALQPLEWNNVCAEKQGLEIGKNKTKNTIF